MQKIQTRNTQLTPKTVPKIQLPLLLLTSFSSAHWFYDPSLSHTNVRVGKRKTSQLFLEPENTADHRLPVIYVSLRPALAHRRSEGPEAAGEGVRGPAALPAKRRGVGGEADTGELLCTFTEAPKALASNTFLLFLSRWCPNSQS